MRRFWFRILIALAMFHVASGSAAPPALAGFWAELWNQATGASKPGPDANGIAAAAAVIKSLAPAGDRTALAAEASPEGHWRLVNRAGETVTAANPDELARALNVLAPELAGDAKARLALYLTEDTVFRQRGSLLQLPSADLNLVVGTQTYKLQKGAPDSALRQSTMVASLSPRLMAGLADRADFDETLAQLDRPLAKAQIRVIALEPGGDGTLPSSPRIDAATQRAVTDSVDPDTLRYRLSNLRGQTALVTGRVDGGLLYFKPSSGPDRSLLLGDLVAAADASDVAVAKAAVAVYEAEVEKPQRPKESP